MGKSENKWYINTVTGQVELGKQSSVSVRMGPYSSRKQAQRAFEIAAERTKAADEADQENDEWSSS
ncbi:hypothetical protein [Corynebacterium sp. ES2715-CONJ3]|uniref:hypothetical protein n=1 Tax=Corynebacterium sp. ES2715-CONJ3 TaxID=2974028 RepID=UPI00216A18B1|nr:hypothetical protein [Corynebacterium sp. ES2715-CONJ3]MCS4492396.1 hypothetical protein [Corynebacterium sp. ES2715-CONJ3]